MDRKINEADYISDIYPDIMEESKCQLQSIVNKIEHLDPVEHAGNLPNDI